MIISDTIKDNFEIELNHYINCRLAECKRCKQFIKDMGAIKQ